MGILNLNGATRHFQGLGRFGFKLKIRGGGPLGLSKLEFFAAMAALGSFSAVGLRFWERDLEPSTMKIGLLIYASFFGTLILWAIVERSSLIFRNKFKGPDTKRQIPQHEWR